MANNEFGLDSRYFSEKLGQLARDADRYKPDEMRRALNRLASVCSPDSSASPDRQLLRQAVGVAEEVIKELEDMSVNDSQDLAQRPKLQKWNNALSAIKQELGEKE